MPGIFIDVEKYYFVESCADLQSDQIDTVKEEFLRFLTFKGICQDNVIMACDIRELKLQCGPINDDDYEWRRKRSTDPEQLKFTFKVKIAEVAVNDLECRECVEESMEQCEQTCKQQYMTQAIRQLNQTITNITEVLGSRANITSQSFRVLSTGSDKPEGMLTINGMTLVPQGQVRISEAKSSCGTGMESSYGLCCK